MGVFLDARPAHVHARGVLIRALSPPLRGPLATREGGGGVERSLNCPLNVRFHSRVPDVEILEPPSEGFVGKDDKSVRNSATVTVCIVGVCTSNRESP